MTEYDTSPEAYRAYDRTMHRVSDWATDSSGCAKEYKNPYLVRSDAGDIMFESEQQAGEPGTLATPIAAAPSQHAAALSHHSRRTTAPVALSSHTTANVGATAGPPSAHSHHPSAVATHSLAPGSVYAPPVPNSVHSAHASVPASRHVSSAVGVTVIPPSSSTYHTSSAVTPAYPQLPLVPAPSHPSRHSDRLTHAGAYHSVPHSHSGSATLLPTHHHGTDLARSLQIVPTPAPGRPVVHYASAGAAPTASNAQQPCVYITINYPQPPPSHTQVQQANPDLHGEHRGLFKRMFGARKSHSLERSHRLLREDWRLDVCTYINSKMNSASLVAAEILDVAGLSLKGNILLAGTDIKIETEAPLKALANPLVLPVALEPPALPPPEIANFNLRYYEHV
ncbi:unnamed protein product, partial [Mycena citricolor]